MIAATLMFLGFSALLIAWWWHDVGRRNDPGLFGKDGKPKHGRDLADLLSDRHGQFIVFDQERDR